MPFQLRSTGRKKRLRAPCAPPSSSGRKRAITAAMIVSAARPAPSSHLIAMPSPCSRQRAAIDAFGARLDKNPRAEQLHDLGAEPAGAGDVPWLLRAGVAQTRGGGGARRGPRPWPVPNFAKPRARFSSGTAQVGTEQPSVARRSWRQHRAGQIFEHGTHFALHRMLRPPIIGVIDAHRAGDAEKARVLAGAIVMQRRRRAGPRQRKGRRMRDRPMRAAAQRRRIETGLRQHVLDAGDVRRLAAVRGASERQFFVAEPVTIGGARFDQRQSL